MDLPIYEIFIESAEKIGIALVDEPAIEKDFIYFNNDKIKMIFNDEKMIVKGPALIPNKLIYKNSPVFGERYVFYSEDTIVNFVELLLNKKENKFNLLHTDNYINANIIESYFAAEDNEFGVPKNSWIISAKIKDASVWEKIKNGEVKGFSVEGMFSSEIVEFAESFTKKTKISMNELKEKLISAINNILFDEKPEVLEPVEMKEEVKEELVKENFEMVDSQEVADKVDEVISQAEMAVDQATPEMLTIDSVKQLLETLKSEIISDFSSQIEMMKKEVVEVNAKVEEFSKQPISESVVEGVANPKIDKNIKAAKFFA